MDGAVLDLKIAGRKGDISAFWYSPNGVSVAILVLFLSVQAISFLTPPFQSPDELSHLSRAYLLSKGEIFLGQRAGETGGNIDTGLLAYMDLFHRFSSQYDRKITAADMRSSRRITWTGKRQFRPLSNTAVYFPLPYLPQALALGLGESLHFSIETTYYLARLFSLLATMGLLWVALLVYPAPLFVFVLFAMPMTLFQMGCASLDSVSFGTTVLGASLFMRGSDPRLSFDSFTYATLLVCIFSLSTSRISLIPVTVLPATLHTVRRSRSYLVSGVVCLLLSLAWIAFALVTVKGGVPSTFSMGDTAKQYLANPNALLRIVVDTFSSMEVLKTYWYMFVGVLGWLDVPLDSYVYLLFGILLFSVATLSIQRSRSSWRSAGSASLLRVAVVSLVFTFIIELLTWTPYDANRIVGIQGRYFIPIAILLAYSIFTRRLSAPETRWSLLAICLSIPIALFSAAQKLLQRYWIS
jgi:uncharacterized membrane protein